MLISCFPKDHQCKFQTSFPNICGNLLYCEHNCLIKCLFYSFKLRHPDRFRKWDILSPSCCHAALQHFYFLNRRVFVQRIRQRQNFWLIWRNFGGISLLCSWNIAVFRIIVCILRRGHVISTLARRFRQILRVRGKYFRKLYEQFVPVKMVYAILSIKLKGAFFRSTKCPPVRFSVVTQHQSRHIYSLAWFCQWKHFFI